MGNREAMLSHDLVAETETETDTDRYRDGDRTPYTTHIGQRPGVRRKPHELVDIEKQLFSQNLTQTYNPALQNWRSSHKDTKWPQLAR